MSGADLIAAFEDLGFTNVKTLIASGNVKFEGRDKPDLQKRFEAGLAEKFGFEIGTVLRSREALRQMVESDPFSGEIETDAQKLYVTLFAEPEAEKLPLPCAATGDFEVVRVAPTEIFHIAWKKPDGRFSADTQNVIWKPFGKKVLWTNRNWNTIIKAAEL